MKIQIISDVHTEFHKDSGVAFFSHLDPKGIDILVVAGDLCDHWNIGYSLEILCEMYPHVLYVMGNHECYGSSISKTRSQIFASSAFLRSQSLGQRGNLHFLDNKECVIHGQRFVGTTMWFKNDPSNIGFESTMNDFRLIQHFRDDVYKENREAVLFLNENVRENDVVITHHLPSGLCVSERFKGSSINRFFVCEMTDLILDRKPKAWIFGHTHDSKDFMMGQTRMLCNPFGYAGLQLNPDYVDQKVIEV